MPLLGPMPTPGSRAFFVSLVLVFGLVALFLRVHPYHGIWHDAVIYTMLALRHLEPEALGGDAVFSHGSQGTFTLFPLLHAAVIQQFGLQQAAWLMTRAGNVAWACCGLLLSRRLLGPRDAWLAIALLIAVPGQYGASSVFAYDESFVSPRTLAEAAVLLALWAALGRQWLWAGVASVAAFLLHPIMAAPGLLLVVGMADPDRAPRRLAIAVTSGLLAAAAVSVAAPVGPLRLIDPQWRAELEAVQGYLFTNLWSLGDWQRTVVPAATLVVALLVLQAGRVRQMARCALAIGAAGIVLSVVTDNALPIALVAQGQPWRWMWITKFVAVLLLVPTAQALWGRGMSGRSVLALLAVGWMGSEDALGMEASLCAVLVAVLWSRGSRPLPYLPAAAMAAAGLFFVGVYALVGVPTWCVGSGVAIAAWWLLFFVSSPMPVYALALLGAGVVAHQVVRNSDLPIAANYEVLARSLQPWTRRIRPDQTVLFMPDSAAGSWLALRRRNYLITFGLVFARETTAESHRRLARVGAPGSPWEMDALPGFMKPPPPLQELLRLCSAPGLDFVVLQFSYPVRHLVASVGPPNRALYLYDCHDLAMKRVGGN